MKALGHGETHLAHGKKIHLSFDAFRDRAGAYAVGEFENPPAYDLFQAVSRAAADELSILISTNGKSRSSIKAGHSAPRSSIEMPIL